MLFGEALSKKTKNTTQYQSNGKMNKETII